MTVNLSAGLMRALGFRPFAAGESITASFVSLSVYETRGIALQSPAVPLVDAGVVAGANYKVAIGASLNETCEALAGDAYVEDIDAWMKEKRTSGPFLLLRIGPTPAYTATTGHIKTESDGSLTTYEAFSALREELSTLEAALPRLVTSISCSLTPPDQYLDLRMLDRVRVGKTDKGHTVQDFQMVVSGSAYASRCPPPEELAVGLRESKALVSRINIKAARFFALGMAEEVELKKFLYFFLALEVETHAVFGRIDQARALQKLLDPGSSPLPATLALLRNQAGQIRNLYDRFVWNAACAWSGITEADVQKFKQLKSARDDIAHGTQTEPPEGYTRQAQQLARKVLCQ